MLPMFIRSTETCSVDRSNLPSSRLASAQFDDLTHLLAGISAVAIVKAAIVFLAFVWLLLEWSLQLMEHKKRS